MGKMLDSPSQSGWLYRAIATLTYSSAVDWLILPWWFCTTPSLRGDARKLVPPDRAEETVGTKVTGSKVSSVTLFATVLMALRQGDLEVLNLRGVTGFPSGDFTHMSVTVYWPYWVLEQHK